jgi:release factor glutamine methyltransferase
VQPSSRSPQDHRLLPREGDRQRAARRRGARRSRARNEAHGSLPPVRAPAHRRRARRHPPACQTPRPARAAPAYPRETDFFDLKLKTDRRGLIPRPETELLLELVTKSFDSAPARILDLGTGTGAIALALAKFWPEATVVAVDRSAEALALARENAAKLSLADRVAFRQSDWFAALAGEPPFQLIVSNPPYLTAAEVAAAEPEVRDHDPVAALVAERDGRADLETIIRGAPAFLAPGGLLALETGIAQHAALTAFAAPFGYAAIESRRDLTDRERFLLLRR